MIAKVSYAILHELMVQQDHDRKLAEAMGPEAKGPALADAMREAKTTATTEAEPEPEPTDTP